MGMDPMIFQLGSAAIQPAVSFAFRIWDLARNGWRMSQIFSGFLLFLWAFHIYVGLQEAGDSSDYSETWDVNIWDVWLN